MKAKNKAYPYGFNLKKEYAWYKEICSKKNREVTYSDWKEKIEEKYIGYDERRKKDFKQYLENEINNRKSEILTDNYCSNFASQFSMLIVPLVSVMFVFLQCCDSVIADVNDVLLEKTNLTLSQIKELLNPRVELVSDAVKMVKISAVILILFFLYGAMIFILKKRKMKEIKFLEDYLKCIKGI